MFVSVILDSEYMGMGERIKWFLKNAFHAKSDNRVIITHEYLKTHFDELVDNCQERFYGEFEMEHISKEDIEKMDICYIPDDFFDHIYEKCGTRSKMIVELSYSRFPEIENYIIDYLNKISNKRGEKIEGIFNCLHCFKSIAYLAELYKCPVIPYVFSAIRKVHGYAQTLYMANTSYDLMNNNEIQDLYKEFDKDALDNKLLSNKEILALLGKERNFPLLNLVDEEGTYELGIAAEGFRITPQSYEINYMTDDDIYYEAKKYYSDAQIITRLHPMQMDQFGFGRRHLKNDPASFLLSCKRIATTQSQMIIKAALWNRVVCTMSPALPYSFLFSNKLDSYRKLTEEELNFIIFGYFIPNDCMFDLDYWRWRLEKPKANEIYGKHLKTILKRNNCPIEVLGEKEGKRLQRILQSRGCNEELIRKICTKNKIGKFDYSYLSSRLKVVFKNGENNNLYSLNTIENDLIVSEFIIKGKNKIEEIIFYPLDDIDGWVKKVKVDVNGEVISTIPQKNFSYYKKGQGIKIKIHSEKAIYIMKFEWEALNNEEYLDIQEKE